MHVLSTLSYLCQNPMVIHPLTSMSEPHGLVRLSLRVHACDMSSSRAISWAWDYSNMSALAYLARAMTKLIKIACCVNARSIGTASCTTICIFTRACVTCATHRMILVSILFSGRCIANGIRNVSPWFASARVCL